MPLYLGIDTSNYTTSTAIYNSETQKIIQSKKLLPVKKGELGLRQSDAVFHHTQQLSGLFSKLMEEVDGKITAVGVSSKPRPVDGSYMPCFSVGVNSASMISSALGVPMYNFSHQEGHISAALFSAKRKDLFEKKFLAFHVSGGTTEALLVRPKTEQGFNISLVGKTLDLNAGQAIDRVGLMLGCCFPCGKELEVLALNCNENIKISPTLKDCDCCLSGLENLCENALRNEKSKEFVAKFCLTYIEQTLFQMTNRIFKKYGKMPVVFAGGVMSNSIIRSHFEDSLNGVFAEPEFSCDNAAGIAYLAYRKDKNDKS